MSTRSSFPRDQRGIALVMALLALLVMSLLAAGLMLSINTNTKVGGHSMRESQALNVAEPGVAEALSHIRNGDVPDNGNPRMVSQIFLTDPGSVPVMGSADSIALPTGQPVGKWLTYSTAKKGPDALTVQYLTDPGKTLIYRYDRNKNPAVQTVSGLPVFVVDATGRRGDDVTRIETRVIQKPIRANAKAALTADKDIRYVGNAIVCGYDHRATTKAPAGENGRGGANSCVPYENGATGALPPSWTTGTTTGGGGSGQDGVPSTPQSGQVGFYKGPWEMLGMTQAEFYSWVGSPQATEPANLNGIVYLDNNGVSQDQSGSFAFHGADGEGFLYVDGDLTINSSFTYRGLIYIEGDLKMNGQAWILGGLVVRGKSEILQNGGSTLLFSNEAITLALSKFGGQFVTLSWKER